MNSRERIKTTLQFEEPDRVPWSLTLTAELRDRLAHEMNMPDLNVDEHFGVDLRFVPRLFGMDLPARPADVPVTEWTPMFTAEQIQDCAQQVRQLQDRGLVTVSGYHMGVFEHLKDWLGDVDALVLPFEDPARMCELLERLTQWKMEVYGAYVQAGIDIVLIGDDLGTQRSLIMSPELYRAWYRPCHEKMVAHYKRINPDVKVAFHSCGHVVPLVRDLIDIGVDILQSVQAETMDIAYLKRTFGRDIAFWGAVGAQSVLARTSPEQVIEGVRKTLKIMASGGGYIASPCHNLTEEVPWDSVVAFGEAMERYGKYPNPGGVL